MLKGIDISKWQGKPNFDLVKQNTQFVILKATEGVGYNDPEFVRNRNEVRRVGLLLGFYHFARPDIPGNTPENEAQYFLNNIGTLQDGNLLVLDYEPDTQKPSDIEWCLKWLQYVFQKTGCRPLIYLNQSQIKAFNWKPIIDADFGLWLARYDENPDAVGVATPWATVAMKQYSNKGSVAGITGNVDMNTFFGEENTYRAYAYKSPVAPTPPTPPGETTDEDKKRGYNEFDKYRGTRTTPNGAEGNYEGFARSVIENDKKIPTLQADLSAATTAKGVLETQLEIKETAFKSVKDQLETAQNKLDELAKNPPVIVTEPKFSNPVAAFFYKMAKFAQG